MHDVQKGRDLLDLVHDNDRIVGMTCYEFSETLGASGVAALDVGRQEIDHQRVGVDQPEPCGFPGSSGTEQEVVAPRILQKSR
jgi:hypothetical protein